jgi:hypothetical protein
MKKILAVIATILFAIPALGVDALSESTNYYTYAKGTVVNFYKNSVEEEAKNQNSGNTTIVLDDKGANDKYVKVFMIGDTYNKPSFLTDGSAANLNAIKQQYISKLRSDIQIEDGEDLYYYTLTDANEGLDLPTVDEVLGMAGMTKGTQTTYTLNNKELTDRSGASTTLFEAFGIIANSGIDDTSKAIHGFYTSTIENGKIWVVEFTTVAAGEDLVVTGATLKQEDFTEDDDAEYAIVGTAYANKTADCHDVAYMCYVCGSTYTYTTVGSQDESCTAVPGITNPADCVAKACYNCDGSYKWLKEGTQDETVCTKVDNVTAEGSCVAAPNTGIESHILEFAIIASLCAIALLAVRRKDLFRTI